MLARFLTRQGPNNLMRCFSTASKNPIVFLEVKIEEETAGRMTFELFSDKTPKTSENFRSLCTGEKGNALHFQGSPFHRIIPYFMAQGGDITNQNGSGGSSIYGERFEDENFDIPHSEVGLLSMANFGKPNTNGSQFFITTAPCQWLDGKNVVFGKLIEGFDVLKKINDVGTPEGKPKSKVIISASGQSS
eukprot:TRINITY_DN16819_c0_g1_i1.p1 TRINITY_DN16819_c0_g1~~TRINITY_DN16819_c0_g1_i1.p1  ORF type:complete len:198 (+),score=94.65 TRINITY_DN16819_c0_g1_i1:25-594(+)